MELIIECLATYSHSIAFPELVVPAVVALKKFTKSCREVSMCKEVALLLEKVS